MTQQPATGTQWEGGESGPWREEEYRGRRITVLASADYVNALEVQAALAGELAEALEQYDDALQMADTALGLAIMFMAGSFGKQGMKPEQFEKLETFVKVNNPRLAIEALADQVDVPALLTRHAAMKEGR